VSAHRSFLLIALLASVAAAPGCHRDRHPWDGAAAPDGGEHALEVPPARAADPSAADAGPDAQAAASEPDAGETEGAAWPPVRVGGPWVRCYGNFHVSGEPLKDVTRLALLCGPENGMSRLSAKPIEGTVAEGGPPVTEALPVRRGTCYRIFATAAPTVADLDVIVRSSRGADVAADHGEDPWPIVQADRPFCALEDDAFTVEITAKRGQGRFAAEIWQLRPPPPLAPEEAARRRAAEAAGPDRRPAKVDVALPAR
jgi:hypothetical protein